MGISVPRRSPAPSSPNPPSHRPPRSVSRRTRLRLRACPCIVTRSAALGVRCCHTPLSRVRQTPTAIPSCRGHRQGEGEGAALPLFALHPDAALMRFHQLAGDVEAAADAFCTAIPFGAVETLEEVRDILGGDAAPLVNDGDVYTMAPAQYPILPHLPAHVGAIPPPPARLHVHLRPSMVYFPDPRCPRTARVTLRVACCSNG